MVAIALPSSIKPSSDTILTRVQWGDTVILGQPVYLDSNTKYKVGAASSIITANVSAIAFSAGVDTDYGYILSGSTIMTFVGTTFIIGDPYFLSATAGNIVPLADVLTGHYVTLLGIALSATTIRLIITPTGYAHA